MRWVDFAEGPALRHRLVHLTTSDMRMLVAQTMLGFEASSVQIYDEADLMVQAFGDRAELIDLDSFA